MFPVTVEKGMPKSPSPSVRERVAQSRERRRRAGLKRVEVFVPSDKVDLVKAYVAQLREGSDSETGRRCVSFW
jgi:hypothetical protein